MLAVIVAVATTDVAFAADSVPAIFAVTENTFLVFAANAFSVLGMLALYFLLAEMIGRFRYLRPALAAILVFVGAKMAIGDVYHVPVAVSLAVILSILAAATAGSLLTDRRSGGASHAQPASRAHCPQAPRYRSHQEVSDMLDRFHTIVVGVDGSEESLAALTQARRLLGPEGRLVAVVVGEERLAFQAGFDAPRMSTEIQEATRAVLDEARVLLADVPGAEVRLAHGRPGACLLEIVKETGADLLAVGSHEHSRVAGILLGSVATEVLHEARRSVLLARLPGGTFGTVVAGVDGSKQSLPRWASPAARRRHRTRRFVRSPPRAASHSTSTVSLTCKGWRGTRATRSRRSSPPPRPPTSSSSARAACTGSARSGRSRSASPTAPACSVLVVRASAS